MRQTARGNDLSDPQLFDAARRFVRNRVFGEGDGKRAAVVRAMANHPKWLTLLPAAIDPSKAEKSVSVVSSLDYLDSIEKGLLEGGDIIPVIDGDLVLSQREGKMYCNGEEFGDFRNFKRLPEVIVKGDVWISGLRGLCDLDISAIGNFKINLCTSLRGVRGEVFGHAVIRGCGMTCLGAGWKCQGALNVFNCRNLELINCEVGGNLTIVGAGLRRTGAAMAVGGDFFISDCDNLVMLDGNIGGDVAISGKNKNGLLNLKKQRPDIRILPMDEKIDQAVLPVAVGLAKRKNLDLQSQKGAVVKSVFP